MRDLRSLLVLLALSLGYAQSAAAAAQVPLPDLAAAANNSLFEKWRPRFHFLGPNSWQNDPCAPYYDAATETYHMFYQYHPQHVQWGNISWGHATSADLVTWTDAPAPNVPGADAARPLAFSPSASDARALDRLGVFSGGAIPDGRGGWAILYTGVQALPTNWQSPYIPHTENVLLARTSDNGTTWHKAQDTPVIASPSLYWNVTGWRDPLAVYEADLLRTGTFASDWPGTAYVTMGSGLKGDAAVAGRVLLYHTVNPHAEHLTQWEFVGPLFHAAPNASWDGGAGWSGNFGQNFEMSGLLAVYPDEEETEEPVWAVHIGVEGLFPAGQPRGLMVMGTIGAHNTSSGLMTPFAVGVGDWGATYAYNHFLAPSATGSAGTRERRMLSAWLPEALTTNAAFASGPLGYQGALILPRELSIVTLRNVTSASALVHQKASWWAAKEVDGTTSVRALGARPAAELTRLRSGAAHAVVDVQRAMRAGGAWAHVRTARSAAYELRTTISFSAENRPAGLVLRASNSSGEATIVSYDPVREELSVDRNRSSLFSFATGTGAPEGNAGLVASYTERGKLRLWEVAGVRQRLNLTIYVDNSLIEIYANDVFALSTRIYPWAEDANEIFAWSNGSANAFGPVELWDGLASAWPHRAANTSLPLVYDAGVGDLWDGR